MGKVDQVVQRAGSVSCTESTGEKGCAAQLDRRPEFLGPHNTKLSDTPQNLLSHVPSL